ncbi:hypothetical protein [Chromobacterium aquaticum]|uniref:Uncharacterized protein n=1 Tax=Chromobacterium aquaticum TaxID=467180 RepID=A0ABV8ZW74_9NEIS|nr:hypothetical protein [Chromobacterium aquaticum]MCD5360849.1 hypothetical protein [Chromobacterium aquaticum]
MQANHFNSSDKACRAAQTRVTSMRPSAKQPQPEAGAADRKTINKLILINMSKDQGISVKSPLFAVFPSLVALEPQEHRPAWVKLFLSGFQARLTSLKLPASCRRYAEPSSPPLPQTRSSALMPSRPGRPVKPDNKTK